MRYNKNMRDLFNKTFFSFLFKFIAIIVISFIVVSAVGYYANSKSESETASSIETN